MSTKIIFRGLKKCFDSLGRFIPDPTPVAIPAGFEVPETLEQKIARIVRSGEMTRHAESMGDDTFEEYDDFEDTPDHLPWSKHELNDLEPPKQPQILSEADPGVSGGGKTPDQAKEPEKAQKAVSKPKIRRTIVEEELDD